MPAIFLDANVPMYAAGAAHSLKEPSTDVLRLAQSSPNSFMTNAEVLQEILHRYLSINRWQDGRRILLAFARLLRGRIEPIYARDVLQAAQLADRHSGLEARDYLHIAVMSRLGVSRVVSTDRKLDSLPGIQRLDPMLVDDWGHIT
jgi:predicted nucleic acid-binding protein